MANLTQDLLAEYYGIGRGDGEALSIRGIDNAALADASQPDPSYQQNESTITGNEGTVDSDEKNSIGGNPLTPPHVAEDEDDEDVITIPYFDELLTLQAVGDDEESSEKKEESPNKSESSLGKEEVGENDFVERITEEIFPESLSGISLVRRKPRRFLKKRVLPPLPKKAIWTETYVDLTNSALELFPSEIFDKYSGLRMLYLANNSLESLPEQLFPSLKYLEWLDVRDNCLTTLPRNIGRHPSLETVLVQGNKIAELPLELCLLPKIKRIHVARNPLIFPPQEIIATGFSTILNFLTEEWNKKHPKDQVKPVLDECEPCPSTILCYPLPSSKKNKPMSISRSATDLAEIQKRIAIRKRYKPSNRYGIQENNTCLIKDQRKVGGVNSNFLIVDSSGKSSESLSYEENEKIAAVEKIAAGEEKLGNKEKIEEINEKIRKLMSPSSSNSFCARRKSWLGKVQDCNERSYKVKLPSIDLKRLHSARKKRNVRLVNQDSLKISKDLEDEEKVFEIVTNDRRKLRLRPTQLNDPDMMLSLLKSCVAANK